MQTEFESIEAEARKDRKASELSEGGTWNGGEREGKSLFYFSTFALSVQFPLPLSLFRSFVRLPEL